LIVLEGAGEQGLPIETYTGEHGEHGEGGIVQINFPALPDTVDLVRRANYNVRTSPAFPDGIHQYMGTDVLKIPVEFELHHADRRYCPQGPFTLIQVASELESLVLPIGSDRIRLEVGPLDADTIGGDNASRNQNAAQATQELGGNVDNDVDLFPPPVCYLELMRTTSDGPGIACRGYIDDVGVKFHGPYMKGPGLSFNLPTKAVFSFTFVHNPSHQNAYQGARYGRVAGLRQAYAHNVRQRLFNTLDIKAASSAYQGFGERQPVTRDEPPPQPSISLLSTQNRPDIIQLQVRKQGLVPQPVDPTSSLSPFVP
jgi:hypothetical protein